MTTGRPQIVNPSATEHSYVHLDSQSYTAQRLVGARLT